MPRPRPAGVQVRLLLLHSHRVVGARATLTLLVVGARGLRAVGVVSQEAVGVEHPPPGERVATGVAHGTFQREAWTHPDLGSVA